MDYNKSPWYTAIVYKILFFRLVADNFIAPVVYSKIMFYIWKMYKTKTLD